MLHGCSEIVTLAVSRRTQENPLFTTEIVTDIKLTALKQLEHVFVLNDLVQLECNPGKAV